MLHFIADLHLDHKNILIYDKRPFATVEEMNEVIITRWNETVADQDEVWVLGDVCWGDNATKYIQVLKGHKHLVCGNHDDKTRKASGWASVQDYKYLRIREIKIPHSAIVLCHYPFASWRNSHHGSLHLHGHCHGTFQSIGKSMDVGCMLHDYRPISLDKVIQTLAAKPSVPHHLTPAELDEAHSQITKICETKLYDTEPGLLPSWGGATNADEPGGAD